MAVDAYRAQDRQRAITLLRTLLQRDPTHENAWMLLGFSVNEPSQKRVCFQRALAINPENQQAREQLNRLASATGSNKVGSGVRPAGSDSKSAKVFPVQVNRTPAITIFNIPVILMLLCLFLFVWGSVIAFFTDRSATIAFWQSIITAVQTTFVISCTLMVLGSAMVASTMIIRHKKITWSDIFRKTASYTEQVARRKQQVTGNTAAQTEASIDQGAAALDAQKTCSSCGRIRHSTLYCPYCGARS